MQITHAHINNSEVTFQLMRLVCPKCKEYVEYILQDDDRLHEKDAEYYKQRCYELALETKRLNQVIDTILTTK